MILKGSQRGGARQLADHLLKTAENEHVSVHDVRGFCAQDIRGALHEAYGTSKGTHCKQFLFSVSLNPPPEESVHVDVFEDALARIEVRNGLTDQPRVVVFHEKEGRRHAHAVWSRIDVETMTAKQMSFFKSKLREVSKELYLENGWQMPRGLMDSKERDPKSFSLAEWQQAKRAGLNAGDLKQAIQECWAVSDSRAAFAAALEERGLYLARGDRRGYVALSYEGDAFAIARYAGQKAKDVRARLGDPTDWRGVDDTKAYIGLAIVPALERHIDEAKAGHGARMTALDAERLELRNRHRLSRHALGRQQRERQTREDAERRARLRKGVAGLWDRVSGRRARTLKVNAAEADAATRHDRDQREAMIAAQLQERRRLQQSIEAARAQQKQTLHEIHRDLARYQELARSGAARDGTKPIEPSHNIHRRPPDIGIER